MTDRKISIPEYHGLAKNSLWVMISNISLILLLVLTILATRILGDEVFGQYIFLLAVATILSNLSVIGTTDYASILIAQDADQTAVVVGNALGLRIPFGILFLLLCLLVTKIFMPGVLFASFLVAMDWIIRSVIHLIRGVLRARNRFHLDAVVSTEERLSVFLCAAAGLVWARNLVGFALGLLLGRAIGMGACCLAYRRLDARLSIRFDRILWRNLLHGGIPIGIRGMLKGMSFRVDAFMLGILRTSAEVGWYGAAYKFLEAGFFFTEAVGNSFQPAIAKAFGQKKKEIVSDLYGRGYKILLVVGGVAAGIGFVYAEPIVTLVFGAEYLNSAPALRLLVLSMLMTFGTMISIAMFDAVGLQHKTVGSFFIALILNVSLNALLIPRLGIMGAAWSTLLTEAYLAVVLFVVSLRSGYTFPRTWLYGPLAACASFILVGFFMPQTSVFLAVSLGVLAFTAVLVALRVFDETDIGYARTLFSRT